MRLPSFEIRNQRGIKYAQCKAVPSLMIIAGPNGSGKSTLLNAIRSSAGYHDIMYVGPHRAMRRQNVMQRHLMTPSINFEKLLEGQHVPSFEGIRIFDGARDPWGYDDTANYLKHALCQTEVDRQQAIATRVDRDGEITRGTIVDSWKPLRELCQNLLPHMSFVKIDATNRDQVKVLWRVHGTTELVDLDDLSSGEKSIIQMFYPLIEKEIKALVAEIGTGPQKIDRKDLCVLIDEPELHLHPNLQLKVLDYLRVLATGSHTQIILATHSPTIVEYASFEELFLLRSFDMVDPENNQLIQVANDEERLAVLREVFGSTANLTALQPIVVVEGVSEQDASKVVPDRKLYRALHPGFDRVTLIAGGGKAECKSLLIALNNVLPQFASQLHAFALLDRDTESDPNISGIELLPVSMIENFLLDADSIWEAIQSILEKTSFKTVDDVVNAIDKVIDELTEAEIGRRTALALGHSHFYPPGSTAIEIGAKVKKYISELTSQYSDKAIADSRKSAENKVTEFRKNNRRREEFNGKYVLNAFYRQYLSQTGLAKVVFTFESARHARRRRSVVSYFDNFFSRVAPLPNFNGANDQAVKKSTAQ